MRRTSLSLAAGLAAALLLVAAPGAQAAVTAKDVPSQADIIKAFPSLDGGTFSTDKNKTITTPGSTCGAPTTQKAASVTAVSGVSASGLEIVVTGVAELKSSAKTKAYVAAYKKYVKACASYTDPTTGATVTMTLTKAPSLGQGSLAFVQQTTFMGVTSHAATVLIRDGKRIGTVAAIDDAPVSSTSVTKLAKVTAKKMK